MILEPYAEQHFWRKGFGFGARFDEEANALLIKSIYKEFSADEAGLQPNTKIISLNGELMDTSNKYCDFSFKGIDKLTMTVEQDGEERTVVLDKRDYFPIPEKTEILLSEKI